MKRTKLSRILGIGLTIAVLASMFVASAPASAGNASWTVEDPANKPPTVTGAVFGRDVIDIAVAGNGSTAYATTSDNRVYKSTNGGASWSQQTAYASGLAVKVAVAPDVADGSFVAVIVGNTVVTSVNGGATWAPMAAVVDGTSGSAATALNSISVAPAIGGARSVAVAGTSSLGGAGVWYFTSTADFGGTAGWVDAFNGNLTNGWTTALDPTVDVTAAATALAVAYSPNFLSDRTLVVVTGNGTESRSNVANIATKRWNADYTVYGATAGGKVISSATVIPAGITAATVELPGSYMAFDATLRNAYITIAGTTGGLFRAKGNTIASLAAVSMWSVGVNAAGDKLVAGAANSNAVYRVATPLTAEADSAAPASKAPSWTNTKMTTVAFFGASVGAATAVAPAAPADETAFGLSADDGRTFNDVAFIDTTAVLDDLAVKADGTKTYVVSSNPTSGVTSLWRKTASWERVYKALTGVNGWMVRPAMDNFDVIFFAACADTAIQYSNDAGQTWQARFSYKPITDLKAESAMVIYVLSGTDVSKAVDGGYLWTDPAKTTGAGTGYSLTLLAKDNLIAAGLTGVAYTTDGGTTWVSTGLAFTGGAAFASADKLTTGGVITAVGQGAAAAVKTFTIGTSAAFGANVATLSAGYSASGMDRSGTVIYIMSDDGVNSEMLRSKITAAAWTKPAAAANQLRGIVAAGGKLMSRNKTDSSIWSYTDVFAAAGPTLTGPAEAFVVGMNLETGNANNVVFQWTAVANAPVGTTYLVQISLDSAFTQVVKEAPATAGVLAIIGQTAAIAFPFQADTLYYWRVRVDGPVDSPYSATRTLKIGALQPIAVSSPASGAQNVPVKPTFVWAPATGATTYEIVVSDDPTFKIITFSRTTDKAMFATDEQLAYGTVYYWRVRASAPTAAVTPFVTGIFTTEAKPVPPTTAAPPITITTQPPATITVEVPPAVEAVPAFLLWIIILIGAILVIALIVLIVRTRRTS